MGSPQHTIELNGHLYDALTGTKLTGGTQAGEVSKPATRIKVVDGVQRPKSPIRRGHPTTNIKTAKKVVQKSKTLMRTAVRKPASHPATSQAVFTPHHIPAPRLNRAQAVSQSARISRFGGHVSRLKPQVVALPVQAAPAVQAVTPLNLQHHASPVARVSAGTDRVSLEQAVHNATSHQQHKLKKVTKHHHVTHKAAHKLRVSPRAVHVAAGFAAAVLIGGYFIYQNIPNLAMKVAATRAGITASLPGYRPAGFALKGGIEYSTGQIKVSYKSNSDDRFFNLVQKASDWTDQALRDNFVAGTKRAYQIFESNGKTIYIFDDSSATWVEKGVWYQIQGNSALSSDQLVRLATSI